MTGGGFVPDATNGQTSNCPCRKARNRRAGFTLIEMLVVLSIIVDTSSSVIYDLSGCLLNLGKIK